MDVSQQNHEELDSMDQMTAQSGSAVPNTDPSGDELIRSLSAIAGLGEESVKSEVAEMLSLSGQSARSEDLSGLSLEQLRAAMLVYLETINADMEAGEQSGSSQTTSS